MKIDAIAGGLAQAVSGVTGTLLSLAAVLVLSACQAITGSNDTLGPSSKPVTIDNVGRDQFANLAEQQHPRILATFGGEYSDPKLERMVAKTVGRLVLVSDDPEQTYRITILDSPNINAFALPGGYLYVTRGLLALANDDSELAAVIAHEMAHVNAKHGILRQKREEEEALAQQVVADLLKTDPTARAAVIRGKLRLAQFSRNQELQADAIGIKAIGNAGFDTFAAPRFLKSMGAFADFRSVSDPGETDLDFLATHPATPKRVELAAGHARAFGAEGTGNSDRDGFLAGLDGMVFGDRPEEGFVRGRTFLHPLLGIGFTVPAGFVIDNGTSEVTATGPKQVAVRFDAVALDETQPLTTYLTSGWVAGLDPASVAPTTVAGLTAAQARAQAENWQFNITVIRNQKQVYRLLTAAPIGEPSGDAVAREVSSSFRLLGDSERAGLRPLRLKIVTASPGDTPATLAGKMRGTDRPLELFRILNGLGPGGSISAGQKVKIVTG